MPSPSPDSGRPRPVVLYVDDQVGNLRVFRANMRRIAEIHVASSGAEGLAMMEERLYPIVISDQRMDGMTGSEFLRIVRERWPSTVRFLLTAHADFNAVVEAINGGQISGFVRKPWKREHLASLIHQANEDYWSAREEQALSEAFVEKARVASLGRMTAGFAHELSNLGEKLSMVELIMDRWGVQEGDSPELDVVHRGVVGVRELAHSVRRFVSERAVDGDADAVDLAEVMPEWLESFRLFDGVRFLRRLRFEGDDGVWIAASEARTLRLALLQVVMNAAEACPPGRGEVELSAEVVDASVHICITDNGAGIPAELRNRIWEPRFTSRDEEHAGLGLTTVRNLLRMAGGTVRCTESAPGRTVFTIVMPLATSNTCTVRRSA